MEREDLTEVERLYTTTKEAFTRALLTADPAAVAKEHERTHAAFVHGRRRIVVGMFPPQGIPVAHSLALLDADDVDPDDFAVAVSRLRGTDDEVHALAVVRVPKLTRLEREVLSRVPALRPGGVEFGYWTEAVVARFAADLAGRAVEFAANEIGIADQIHAAQNIVGQVEHAADDIVGAAFDAADAVIHGLAQAAGIDAVIQAGQDPVHAVANVVDAAADVVADAAEAVVDAAADVVGDAADAVVGAAEAVGDAVGDAVGAAVDWVAENVFGDASLEFQQRFEEAAAAQKTFKTAFGRQIEAGTMRLDTIRPAASLDELVAVRAQLVRQAAARTPRVSLLRKRL